MAARPAPAGFALASGLAALLIWPAPAAAARATEGAPLSWRLGHESLRLPNDESLGLVGASALVGFGERDSGWFVGPAVYGAAKGRRGGLFVLGGEALWRTPGPLGSRLEAGLFVGGGGGAVSPVGGGLMLRPQLTWSWPVGVGWVGATASRVTFPSGEIRSNQVGLSFSVDDRLAYRPAGSAPTPSVDRAGVGFDRFWLHAGQYRDDARGHYGYGGLRGDHWVRPGVYVGLEAAGAAQGSGARSGVGGYAELLGTVGVEWPVFGTDRRSGPQLGVRGAVGMAGGGAVDTGGGALLKLAGTLTWPLRNDLALGVEAGRTVAPDGTVRATHWHLALGMTLDRPLAAGLAPRYARSASEQLQTRHDTYEWTGAVSHFPRVQFRDGSTDSLQTVGVRVRRALSASLDPRLQLAGGIHFAAGGKAGAYGAGLVGLAWASPLAKPGWQWGAEVLAGAAGGGGIDTRGGAALQPMLRTGWASGHGRWQLGVGRIKSRSGALDANVIELTIGVALDVPRR